MALGIGKLIKHGQKFRKGKLAAMGITGTLGSVGAGIWGAVSAISKVGGVIMDMMQFSAIMNTQEMVKDLSDQVESLKYRTPQYNEQLKATRDYLDGEQENLARSVEETSHQLASLGRTETNIRVINGKPIDSIMYGFDTNIDESMSTKYQLSGSDTQLMNSPNIGFNELAKATLNSKAEVINEVRKARNDSIKGLNRNAKLIANAGRLSGANLKYNEEKLEGLDKKLDLMYGSLSQQAGSGLAGSSAVTNLIDSTKEEPHEKSLSEKLGEMYAKITSIPERLAIFGAKTALSVLAAGAAIKLIADLINSKGGSDDPTGLDENATNLAIEEYELRENGLKESEIRDKLSIKREDLRREQANKLEGYDGGTYNYVSKSQGLYYESVDAEGNYKGKVFLDNQTLGKLGEYYNSPYLRKLDGSKGYKGAVMPISNLMHMLFILYSPKSLSAVTQACVTINMLPKDAQREIKESGEGNSFTALEKLLDKHTTLFQDKVFKPVTAYIAKTLTNLMLYKDKNGVGNLVVYDQKSKTFIKTSLAANAKPQEIAAMEMQLYELFYNILNVFQVDTDNYYGLDLYKDSTKRIEDRSSIGKEVARYTTNTGIRVLETVGGKGAAALGIGLDIGSGTVLGGDNISEGFGTVGGLAYGVGSAAVMSFTKHPLAGVILGTAEYLVNIGIDIYQSSARLKYYSSILNVFNLGENFVKKNKTISNPFTFYLTGTASSALLSRTLLFYKKCVDAYMSSYNKAYDTKGKELEAKGEVEYKSGYYYNKSDGKLMGFSLEANSEDRKSFESNLSNSFLGNFNEDLKDYEAGNKAFVKNANVNKEFSNLQSTFSAGDVLNLKSVENIKFSNVTDMAEYADKYNEAYNMEDEPDGVLTKSLYAGMNKFVMDRKKDKYDEKRDRVKVRYTSGARNYNPHDPKNSKDKGWGSHHKYGLAVDVGNLDAPLGKLGLKNNHTSKNALEAMVNFINKELEDNNASHYKVVLEPNADENTGKPIDKYHLHIINGKPFTEGKLPWLPNEEFVTQFKKHFVKVPDGYDWTRFGGKKNVYYDKNNINFTKEVKGKLSEATESQYTNEANKTDIGDPIEAKSGDQFSKISDTLNNINILATANSLKLDAANKLICDLCGEVGGVGAKIHVLSNSNKSTVPPGSELLNTNSRSL